MTRLRLEKKEGKAPEAGGIPTELTQDVSSPPPEAVSPTPEPIVPPSPSTAPEPMPLPAPSPYIPTGEQRYRNLIILCERQAKGHGASADRLLLGECALALRELIGDVL